MQYYQTSPIVDEIERSHLRKFAQPGEQVGRNRPIESVAGDI